MEVRVLSWAPRKSNPRKTIEAPPCCGVFAVCSRLAAGNWRLQPMEIKMLLQAAAPRTHIQALRFESAEKDHIGCEEQIVKMCGDAAEIGTGERNRAHE